MRSRRRVTVRASHPLRAADLADVKTRLSSTCPQPRPTGVDGTSPPAWTSSGAASSSSPGSNNPMGRAWGRLQRAVGVRRPAAGAAGLNTFTLTGVWRAAGTVAAAADGGVQTVRDVALAVAVQPSVFYAVVASPGFEAGAARGQFQKAPKEWAFRLRK
ncbi:unnamed protein product [Closterium sp. Naga37s-1]|nr:unnamed protein product [Closterium sp. Naga37s-1]